MDLKKCFSALKKCNEIGKKMTPSSKYVLINGMILAYQNVFANGDKNEYSACGISVSFIDEKIVKDLDALAYIPLEINGTEVYRMNKEYEFNRFEVSNDFVYLIYRGLYTDDNAFNDDFIASAVDKGYDRDMALTEIAQGFLNNIDLYEFYINFKKTYKAREVYKEFKLKLKVLHEDNKILKKCNRVIDTLLSCDKISEKDLDNEIYSRIMDAGRPMVMKFKDENDNEIFKIRLMKSLFKTGVAASKINMKILKDNNIDNAYYLLLNVINKGFYTINVYKTINY